MSSKEMFYRQGGVKKDEALHEPLLSSRRGQKASTTAAYKFLRGLGVPTFDIRKALRIKNPPRKS